MPVRLKDVAERAGVSIKTASNVVNGYAHVTPETRSRVQSAVSALGYRPNLTARSLRGGRTGVVALAVPDLSSPYFAEIARGIIIAAERRGWTVLVDQTDGVRDRELTVLRGIRDRLIDGVIFSPLALGPEDFAATMPDVPMVCLGERAHAGAIDHIAIDNVAAARHATAHLLGLGRRRIAAVGAQESPTAATAQLRLAGYRQALADHGMADAEIVEHASEWHRSGGFDAATRLMNRPEPPDAMFCFNDLLALGAMHALAGQGVSVPGDVAVVGIDDIEEGRFVRPTLTTVSPDKDAIARTSVDLLAARIAGGTEQGDGRELEVDFRLVVRESA